MKNKSLLLTIPVLFFTISCIPQNDEKKYDSLELSFSHSPGFYDSAFHLVINKDHDAKITYTIDGTEPTFNSEEYKGGINITNQSNNDNKISNIPNISSLDNVYFPNFKVDKCNYIRVKGFDKFDNESPIYNLVYFVGLNKHKYYKDMPIVTLNTDVSNLFDYEKGIYVTGKTYDEGIKEGYPETYPANYNNTGKDWERPVNFSYFDKDHKYIFSQDIGMRIHGGWTRAFNQKGFNLYARKEYSGKNHFDKKLFETKETKTFMLRSGGYRDSYTTKIRDSLTHSLAKPLGIAVQDSFPVILFLNNEYWGIYNMQERYSDTYVAEHYSIDKDNVIIIEKDEIDEGKSDDINLYNEMINFFRENDLSSDETYEAAKNIVNVDDFINYMATELVVGNIDWPGNNVRMWRSRIVGDNPKEDGKWRFMMYDTDDSMDIHAKCSPDSDPFDNSTHWSKGPLDSNCTIGLIFNSLLTNSKFKSKFREQFTFVANETFSKNKVIEYVNQSKTLLESPMQMHYKRFVSQEEAYLNGEYFNKEINKIKSFYEFRNTTLLNYLDAYNI